MQLYFSVTPDQINPALALTPHLAHAAFRTGADGALLSRPLPSALRGGLALVQCDTAFPEERIPTLARELLQLCLQRGFSGIVLDGFTRATAAHRGLSAHLSESLDKYGRRFYVPPCCAESAPRATVLICTALSGGTLQELLSEAIHRYGAHRIALDLQRLCMIFPLPCPSGEGTPLTPPQLAQRIAGHSVYYSSGLCSRYFTCHSGNATQFVLFDDADTLRRKMMLAGDLGISEGFVMWPEICDIAADLFEKKKEGEP